jgi:hypothetical protein
MISFSFSSQLGHEWHFQILTVHDYFFITFSGASVMVSLSN